MTAWRAVAQQLQVCTRTPVSLSRDKIERAEDGAWAGVLGYLQRGAADVAIGDLLDRQDRLQDFHMTTFLTWEPLRVWLHLPPPVRLFAIPYLNLPRDTQVLYRRSLLVAPQQYSRLTSKASNARGSNTRTRVDISLFLEAL